ncbi:MAG: PAS domain-containing protein [Pseudomonadota bacterium]
MDARNASIEHIHQLALMLIRLFAGPRWEPAVARQAEAALQAAAQGWQHESDPRLRDASRRVLRRLEGADHFDGVAAIDRSPLIEQLLALRDELLVGDDPGTDAPAPGTTWADLAEDEPRAAGADGLASARFAAAATAEAIARLRRAHLAVDQHALVSVTDRQGVITEANERFCEVSGYRRDELLGTTHRVLKSGRHPDAFYRQMWETILAGEVWHGEICNRRKDGAYYWVQSTILPILDADGRPDQFVSIRTDVTALKATEERLGLLERAMHSSSSGVVIVDALRPHAPVIYASRPFGEMALQGEGDPAGRALAEVLPQSGLRLAAEGELPAAQTLCAPGPGGPRTLDLRWAPVLNEAGVRTHWVGVATDVTEIEQARRRLLDSEERLRRSQVYADIGTWDWNIQTGELYWSERIAPLFGYPGGDLETSYDNFLKAVHPDDRAAVEAAVRRCIDTGERYEIEHRCVWPDGSVRWLLERGDVTRDAAGRPLHMLGVVQDITSRKTAEIGLMESQRRLLEAQRLSQIGDWDADLVTGAVRWSEMVFQIHEKDPDTFVPTLQTLWGDVHPSDRALIEAAFAQLDPAHPMDVIHRILAAEGTVRWVHVRAKPMRNAQGRILRLLGTTQDITARIQLEDRTHLLRQVVETTDQAIAIAAPSGELLYSNPAYHRALGYAGEPPAGTSIFERIAEPLRDEIRRVLARGDGRVSWQGEVGMRRTDGRELVTMSNLGVVHDGRGEVHRLFHVFSDITAEIARQKELQKAKEAAERANEAKSAFLSRMSHELRTPLNAVLGFAQLLELRGALPPQSQEYVRHILRAGKHLLELIGEVLDLAKVEAGRIGISPEHVDLLALVRESLDLLAPVASQRGVTLEPLQGEPTYVVADRTRLKQVLANLLSNAIKYNRPHGWVRVEMGERGGEVSVTVRDSGRGLTDEQQTRLFEPFERFGAEELGIEGTGIGLAISKRLVELMQGRIEVESIAGVGSAFTVMLPAGCPPTAPAAAVEASAALPVVEGPPRKVLYVEDNPDNVALVREVLAPHRGWQLLVAPSAMLGIELALAHQPDLVLLDINLPQMDGFAFLQMLRGHAALDATPVIAVTADVTGTTLRRLREAGFFGLVEKPIDIARLVGLIEGALADPGPAP